MNMDHSGSVRLARNKPIRWSACRKRQQAAVRNAVLLAGGDSRRARPCRRLGTGEPLNFGEGIAPITLVPQDITRVLLNLSSNGFFAARQRQSRDAPGFEPTLNVVTRELGNAVEIRVRDNGVGIPAEIRDKLFQPFFTTKPTGEGTGLGLSISYDIITQQHGGSITVDSKVGEYSEFTIRLPRNP
jgi:signal transduction histidine kinase